MVTYLAQMSVVLRLGTLVTSIVIRMKSHVKCKWVSSKTKYQPRKFKYPSGWPCSVWGTGLWSLVFYKARTTCSFPLSLQKELIWNIILVKLLCKRRFPVLLGTMLGDPFRYSGPWSSLCLQLRFLMFSPDLWKLSGIQEKMHRCVVILFPQLWSSSWWSKTHCHVRGVTAGVRQCRIEFTPC
jgi:hypothetical protein